MAYVYANSSINTDGTNLFQMYAGIYDWTFWPNFSVDYFYQEDGYDAWLELYGQNIGFDDWSGNMYAGTITDFYQYVWDGWEYVELFGVEDIFISAASFMSAMETPSVSDDLALTATMFSGNDFFDLSNYADLVRGYGGSDTIYGYGGADRLYGGGGSDKLYGGLSNDTLVGDVGNDLLIGDGGGDLLSGGGNNDVLRGGAGRDTLNGGAGSDDFIFLATSDSAPAATTRDVITGGFQRGSDDIVVSSIDAKASVSGNQAFALDTNGSFSQGEIRQKVTSSGLLVEFNTDSDVAAEMAILVQGLTSRLAATDFVL